MTVAPPLRWSVPACQREPERWFDPHDRVEALTGCLTCPVRRWCAREALSCKASWGMWAGVWIDETHDGAATYLRAIADGGVLQADSTVPMGGVTAIPPPPQAAPLSRPVAAAPERAVPAALLARSSGHCEVMSAGCRFSFDRTVSRRAATSSAETSTPAELFAACRHCADVIAGSQPDMVARSGYVVPTGRDPALTPFRWRGTRWVLLGRDGWITEICDDARTA